MADVFLSYAREDMHFASQLAALLEANGVSVWWDRRLIAGDEINSLIEQAIEQAKAVVVLWSPDSVRSRWVNGEAEAAAETKKLVPVRIRECKIPINFRTLHTPDLYKSTDHFAELASLLSAKVRVDAPDRRVVLSPTSTARFMNDLRILFSSPSENFLQQMRREWDFSKRHPLVITALLLLAFPIGIFSAMLMRPTVFYLFWIAVTIGGAAVYFVYRHYRLSRTRER